MRPAVPARLAVSLCLLALSACSPDLILPDGANVSCTTAADCPSGYTCVLEASRCVRSDASFDVARVVTASVAITPELPRARGASSTIAFQLDRAVRNPPSVRLAWLGGDAPASLVSAGADGRTLTYAYTVGSAEPEGSLTLVVDSVSDAGVPARFEKTRAIELDFTPPALVPDTLSKAYRLPAGAVVDSVSAVGLGGEASLLFAVNEPTTGTATLELEPAEALGQSCGAPVGSFYSCTVPLPSAPAAQGSHAVFANVTDVAGNSTRLDLGTVTLDTVAPAAPDVVTAGRVVYTRAPHGSDASGGSKSFSIAAAAGAVEPGARLVVFDGAPLASASRIGSGVADAQGAAAAIALVPADRARVYVAAVDAAGNPSDADPGTPGAQAVQVRDVEWFATLAGKVALDPFSNPHRVRGYGVLPAAVYPRTAAELTDNGRFRTSDGSAYPLEGAGTWARLDPGSAPANSTFWSYTDTWRGELRAFTVSFNGWESWRYTGGGWQSLPTLDLEFDGFPELALNGAAFDAQRGEVVLVGSATRSGDTWVLADQSWRLVPGSGGPPLDDATLVYDDNLGRVLLFGGAGASGYSGDTWAWNGTFWEVVATTGPPPRSGAIAFFDPTIGKVVLFGGFRRLPAGQADCGGGLTTTSGGVCSYRDTWLWDGTGWTRACDSTTADCGTEPTPRIWARSAYDPIRKRAVLFGGGYTPNCVNGISELCTDLYEWNGAAWSRPTPADPSGDGSAQPRVNHVLGWDPIGARLLAAAGDDEFDNCGGTDRCRQTWHWTGSDWLLVGDPTRALPFVQGGGVWAYDGARNEIVYANGTNVFADTTWTFNGRLWTAYTTGNPVALSYPSGTGSPNGVYRYGGYTLSTSNATGDLTKRTGTTWAVQGWTTRPLSRAGAGTTYVDGGTTPHVLVYGGNYYTNATQPSCPGGGTGYCYLDDVWGYGAWGAPTCSGAGVTCWRNLGTGPPRRGEPALVATTGGEAILFGGAGPSITYGDIWRWNGTSWTQVLGTSPIRRLRPVSAYDVRRGKVLVAGGLSGGLAQQCGAAASDLPCPDAWEFDGAAWRQRKVADAEGDGNFAGAPGPGAYANDGLVYVEDNTRLGGLWRWDGGYARRPAFVAELDFSAAGAPEATTVERVEVAVTARATSQTVGASPPDSSDVSLLVGEPLGWRTVATAGSGGASASLAFCTSRTAAAGCEVGREAKLLLGRNRTLLVATAPAGTNGTGVATVNLDYVEVKVRYRMPDPAEE